MIFPLEIWANILAYAALDDILSINECMILPSTFVEQQLEQKLKKRAPWICPGNDGYEPTSWSQCCKLYVARFQSEARFVSLDTHGITRNETSRPVSALIPFYQTEELPEDFCGVRNCEEVVIPKLNAVVDFKTLQCKKGEYLNKMSCRNDVDSDIDNLKQLFRDPQTCFAVDNGKQVLVYNVIDFDTPVQIQFVAAERINGELDIYVFLFYHSLGEVICSTSQNAIFISINLQTFYVNIASKSLMRIPLSDTSCGAQGNASMVFEYDRLLWTQLYGHWTPFLVDLESSKVRVKDCGLQIKPERPTEYSQGLGKCRRYLFAYTWENGISVREVFDLAMGTTVFEYFDSPPLKSRFKTFLGVSRGSFGLFGISENRFEQLYVQMEEQYNQGKPHDEWKIT